MGRCDGVRLLETPGVQRELSLQRGQGTICRADVLRRLAQLAFGRANDCVKLVLLDEPELDALDLSLLSEVKRNEKGTVEIKPLEMFIPGKGIYTGKTEYAVKAWDNLGEHFQTELFDRYDGMMAGFARFVRGEAENPYTPDYELEVYKTVLKACGVAL